MQVDLTVNRWRFIIGSEREAERKEAILYPPCRCGTVHAGVSSPDFHAPCVGVFSRQSPSLLRLI